MRGHAEEIIKKTADALQRIRNEGVFVVDVNEGTFLFDQTGHGIDVHVLDFELGYDVAEGAGDGLKRAAEFLAKNDPAFRNAPERMPKDTEHIAKCEMYRWASMLRGYIAPRMPTEAHVAPELQTAYREYMTNVKPALRDKVINDARRLFANLKPERPLDAKAIAQGEEVYVENSIKHLLPREIRTASLPYTLPSVLEANGIVLDEKTTNFLARSLSYDVNDRPNDFSELLST